MVGVVGDSQIIGNLPATNVPWCTGSNEKTLGLQRLQFLDMGSSGGPPDMTNELLIQQSAIADGQTISPV
jgi:hypothetical protein